MKITELDIEQFGLWRNLRLPLNRTPLSVIYGPNEAGKSTLVRFIRSLLYGFCPSDEDRSNRVHSGLGSAGQLHIEHHGREFLLRRELRTDGYETLSATDTRTPIDADTLLTEILGDVDKTRFSGIYALGLNELQELSTLHDEEFVERIYGMSLGSQGQRILDCIHRFAESKNRLLSGDEKSEIRKLLDQDAKIEQKLRTASSARIQHRELRQQLNSAKHSVDDTKRRQAGIQSQLRGHHFMERIWKPWNNVEELRAELSMLPHVDSFPEDGLAKLDELRREIDSFEKCRQTLLAEAKEFRSRADQLSFDANLEKHVPSIQDLLDQSEAFCRLEEQCERSRDAEESRRETLKTSVDKLGDHWSLNRLQALSSSADEPQRLVSSAMSFRKAVSRRNRYRSRMQRLARRSQHFSAEVSAFEQTELGGCDVEDVIVETRRSLASLRELSQLKMQLAREQQQEALLVNHRGRLEMQPRLPGWIVGVSGFFIVAGVLLSLIGISTGITTDALTGTLYATLGAICGYFVWKFKQHTETQVGGDLRRIELELREVRSLIRDTRASIGELEEPEAETDQIAELTGNGTTLSEDDLIGEIIQRLAELEQIARRKAGVHSLRRRLTDRRSRFRTLQHEARSSRQAWCEVLGEIGLTETVSIGDALQEYKLLIEARNALTSWTIARDKVEYHEQAWGDVSHRIEKLGQRMQRWDLDYTDPLAVLELWERELKVAAEQRKQRDQLLREEELRKNEEIDYAKKLDAVQLKYSALLVQGGSSTPEEFEERALVASNRLELEELLAEAQLELEEEAKTEPDLALVEEDLLAYDAEENERRIEVLKSELADIDVDLQEAYEQIGRIKEQMTALEHDSSTSRLRLEREQVRTLLKQKTSEWLSLALAEKSVEKIRKDFERRNQPSTLRSASKHLERMSCGRHHNIWTPLATQQLRVDDESKMTFGIEELSGGTREQLFLSIRFSLVEQLRNEGVHLPFVLDDVFVNFDDRRSESAVESLIDFSGEGQQILFFTCHRHLADMFARHGVEPIRLPTDDEFRETRRAG